MRFAEYIYFILAESARDNVQSDQFCEEQPAHNRDGCSPRWRSPRLEGDTGPGGVRAQGDAERVSLDRNLEALQKLQKFSKTGS